MEEPFQMKTQQIRNKIDRIKKKNPAKFCRVFGQSLP